MRLVSSIANRLEFSWRLLYKEDGPNTWKVSERTPHTDTCVLQDQKVCTVLFVLLLFVCVVEYCLCF